MNLQSASDSGVAVPPVTGLEIAVVLAEKLRWLVLAPLLASALALGVSYLVKPTFTARTSLLPPQQPQNSAAMALASLGAIGNLAGAAGGLRNPTDLYVALVQSRTIQDELIATFDLARVYDKDLLVDTRETLQRNVRVAAGRRDGMITIEVDDLDPKRAAAMASHHVEALRKLSGQLLLTEAQQRRALFETQLKRTSERLRAAQVALEGSGFNRGALKAEPRAAAERYARLQAEVTAAEVRLQTLRSALADTTPEIQAQMQQLSALRAQLARTETAAPAQGDADYITRYREFKYQETLFELFSRQYELARVDESREGVLIQVVDPAQPPERKSSPRRSFWMVLAFASTLVALVVMIVGGHLWRRPAADDESRALRLRLRRALGFGRRATA